MNDTVKITYTGSKAVKTDTITGSRILFPRHAPVDVPSAIAHSLLAFPDCWIRYEHLAAHDEQQQQRQQHKELEQQLWQQQQAALAEELSYTVSTRQGQTDISKYTSAQLETLAEAEDLNITREIKQPVAAYRDLIRDALKARAAASEAENGHDAH